MLFPLNGWALSTPFLVEVLSLLLPLDLGLICPKIASLSLLDHLPSFLPFRPLKLILHCHVSTSKADSIAIGDRFHY